MTTRQVRQLDGLPDTRRGAGHGDRQSTWRPLQPLLRPGAGGRGHNHGDADQRDRRQGRELSLPHREGPDTRAHRVERVPSTLPGDLPQVRRRLPRSQPADATRNRGPAGRELQSGEAAVQLSEESGVRAGAAAAADGWYSFA